MGRVGRQLRINFVVSVGDNFYQAGLKGPHDTKFKNSFSKVYTARSLQTQWFAGTTFLLTWLDFSLIETIGLHFIHSMLTYFSNLAVQRFML